MKIWMVAIVIGILAIAGFVVASSIQNDEPVVVSNAQGGCGSCGGGCSAGNACSSPSCGINNGGSCGCGK